MQGFRQGAAMAAVRVVRRLREAGDWQREMDGILETLCRAIECQRGILFRLRELPGQGFAQSVAAYWIDPDFGGELASPTVIMAIYRELLAERPELARRFVLVTGDLIGAKAEIEALPAQQRPQILEKPFSTLDVRSVLSSIAEQAALKG